ncbi:MAG: Maf family protein [Porcipelethomonas sp.]
MNTNIVLGSASPRRRELLKLITENFEVRPSEADEHIPENITADKAAEYLAGVKSAAVEAGENETVICCDTVVVSGEKILGKPSDRDDCRRMLKMLSGSTHFVYTGVCILKNKEKFSFTEKTAVTFHNLSDREIEDYMDTGEPFDKAGGYGIQGRGALLVKSIHGDYFNVVGLPVSRLNRELIRILNK